MRRDGEVALDDDESVALGGLPEFTHGGIGDAVGEHDVLADEFDGLESSERDRYRPAADFFGRWRRRARVGRIDLRAELPARGDRVAEPKFAFGLRGRELASQRLAARVVVGARSERLVADAFAAPDGGDPEQVGVEAGPGVVGQLDDQSARGEVVFPGPLATGVED